jgi:hypothetical protein
VIRTLEFDDYPQGAEQLIAAADRWKKKWPDFKMTVFCVPLWMQEADYKPLLDRSEWVQVGIHGFNHIKGECRMKRHVEANLPLLDALTADTRYSSIFKAPWYGYGERIIRELADRRMVIAADNLAFFPEPTPKDWKIWSRTERTIRGEPHLLVHPDFDEEKVTVRMESPGSSWEFVMSQARPALLKINLACGRDVWDGWASLDPRSVHPDIINWSFDEQIPFGENMADVILTSHSLQHIPTNEYAEAFLECWRVLRPGGVLRLHQDDAEGGHVWRGIGHTSRVGKIKSAPDKSSMVAALRRVGFSIVDAEPGKTLSPHQDVLRGDNRTRLYNRGGKVYIEAVKDIEPDLVRRELWRVDHRATKKGRYRLPD